MDSKEKGTIHEELDEDPVTFEVVEFNGRCEAVKLLLPSMQQEDPEEAASESRCVAHSFTVSWAGCPLIRSSNASHHAVLCLAQSRDVQLSGKALFSEGRRARLSEAHWVSKALSPGVWLQAWKPEPREVLGQTMEGTLASAILRTPQKSLTRSVFVFSFSLSSLA